jgi:uncharacterized protein YfaS (alpha-2-macroglobulin family)
MFVRSNLRYEENQGGSNFMRILLSGVLLMFMNLSMFGGPRDAQWKLVEDAIKKGLPQTAITNLEPIITASIKDKAYAEAVKAIGRKIALEGNIQGNKPEEKITRLEAERAKAPKEMVPMLDTLLAHWYWQYFQQNRWRFIQRTTTAEPPGKDFTTWDLPTLFVEIDRQFQNALKAEALLQATPISAWDDLLPKGTMPDAYRPTLYDFISHEALEFYTSGEQAGARPQNDFEPTSESPLLDPSAKFMAWKLSPSQEFSPVQRAIQMYQALLRFHKNDPAPQLAFADVDLERLGWGWNVASGDNKNQRYQAALEDFIRTYADFDISTRALHAEARLFQQQDDLVKAHEIAARGAGLFPGSPGSKQCRNLVTEIEAKSASISTERVWNRFPGSGVGLPQSPDDPAANTPVASPTITVSYRNVDIVYFRAIRYDWEIFLQKRHNRPESLSDTERRQIIAQTPALEWSEPLPVTTDYKEKTAVMESPDSLRPGFYFIVASHDSKFSEKQNVVSLVPIWVTDLALVTRTRNGQIEGFVLGANSGQPIPGAEVSVWHLDQNGNRVSDPALKTDENGAFILKSPQNRSYLFRARFNDHELGAPNDLWSYNIQTDTYRPQAQTMFFTDRAIYRPGQTVKFKGICLWVDQSKDDYQVLKGESVEVLFRDQNGKEIARQTFKANDYGSFAGSFIAPRDRLMGQMSLVASGRAQGTAWIRVEEYKRPKFQVTLEAPKLAAKLNEKISLTGHAMTYAGAAVDGAPVRYRVVRQARMPWWWGWYGRPWQGSDNQEIAHGSVTTETDGSFKVEFAAKPDPKIPESDEPTFVFQINTDVTDSAGETRSAERNIRVGYTALEATISASDWQTSNAPVEMSINTKTLDDEPQVAEGRVQIYELQAPARPQAAPLGGQQLYRYLTRTRTGVATQETNHEDMSNPNNWPLGKVLAESGFTTDTNGAAKLSFKLAAGIYRAVLETQDRFGKKVTGKLPIQVQDPDSTRLATKIPYQFIAPSWQSQPGDEFSALWGTGYESGRAFIEIEHRNQMLQRFWTQPGRTQQQVKLAVTEAMRGGFTIHVTQIREDRAYVESRRVDVPWSNKELDLKWEHFVSKLQPGQKETWTAVITKPGLAGATNGVQTEQKAAEMVATLYDESLDAFAPFGWPDRFGVFRQDYSTFQTQFGNQITAFQHAFGNWDVPTQLVDIRYRTFPADLTANLWGYASFGKHYGGVSLGRTAVMKSGLTYDADAGLPVAAAAPAVALNMAASGEPQERAKIQDGMTPLPGRSGDAVPKIDLSQVTARKNLNETAFFYPQLVSDSNGTVRINFTMPEALTKWHFMGFAHDTAVCSGLLQNHAVTSKDLMVQPNPPRFLREGDTVEFSVKVSNQSDQAQVGSVNLTFTEISNGQSADKLLNVRPTGSEPARSATNNEQRFDIPAKQSRAFQWRVTVPDGCGFLTYKAVGASTSVSDGEEGAIPVLSRRILVTESLPLPIRGPATKKFEFTKLLKSGASKSLQNQSLTVQMVSNPAWYAVLALPYLMEYPHECSEQTFNRFYANVLARTVVGSDPKIHRVFDQWRNTPVLESPLEKNRDLKSVALEETPWLRQAESESQARKNVGILFEDNRLNYEIDRTLEKLTQMQLPDGAWPWFPGGRGNDYITLYITTGFGRLRHLGADINIASALQSLARLDTWMTEAYERIQRLPNPEKYVPSATDALFLYCRSFFLKDRAIAPANQKAIDFFLNQARKFWLQTNCRQSQGQLAIALDRFSSFTGTKDPTPASIMNSIRERSVTNDEMGMFWRETELSWWWYRAPIETQALMIEAFDEVMHDQTAVENCKVWLLKQKQTQDWKTTKATADSVYALLLRGKNLLASDKLVQVKLDGLDLTPSPARIQKAGPGRNSETANQPEPGTGFYEVRFAPADIKPKLGAVTVTKSDEGVAWGSVHWQYLEDMSKVTPYEGTPLKLTKTLFTKTATNRGQVLEQVKGPIRVGDELVVRIELRVDRDMEYVHMKDQRGSGTEPVNVLSQYKYQDGLAYYESTRDTATHFLIDYLPKGTYVFEYSTRVQLRGRYQTGIANIQCMYAPEFDSHSSSIELTVN